MKTWSNDDDDDDDDDDDEEEEEEEEEEEDGDDDGDVFFVQNSEIDIPSVWYKSQGRIIWSAQYPLTSGFVVLPISQRSQQKS